MSGEPKRDRLLPPAHLYVDAEPNGMGGRDLYVGGGARAGRADNDAPVLPPEVLAHLEYSALATTACHAAGLSEAALDPETGVLALLWPVLRDMEWSAPCRFPGAYPDCEGHCPSCGFAKVRGHGTDADDEEPCRLAALLAFAPAADASSSDTGEVAL